MNDITATEEIVFSYPMRDWQVEILYMRYSGGGEAWEYRVFQNGVTRHQSENGYGSPEAAARDGFGWILENE